MDQRAIPGHRPGPHDSFLYRFYLCFLPIVSVAGVGERLLSVSEAGFAAHFRRKGCAKDAAARLCGRGGFGQGETP